MINSILGFYKSIYSKNIKEVNNPKQTYIKNKISLNHKNLLYLLFLHASFQSH